MFPVLCLFDFKKQDELFDSYFANQCLIIANSSVLSSDIELFADESNITLSNDIRKTIRGLDFDKVHGHNMRVFTC